MLIPRGHASVFVTHWISAFFLFLCVVLIGAQIYVRLRGGKSPAVPIREEGLVPVQAAQRQR
jgi:putative tricarboxylic transport membrane protein